jgi:hypothetical protein
MRARFVAPSGAPQELELLVDTGSPFPVILGLESLRQLKHNDAGAVDTNFGPMEGGWLRVALPELRLDRAVLGYAGDAVIATVRASSPDFKGLAGLPLLRMLAYGGDADSFWIRPTTTETLSA